MFLNWTENSMIINLYKSFKKIIIGINFKNTNKQTKNTKIKIINKITFKITKVLVFRWTMSLLQ